MKAQHLTTGNIYDIIGSCYFREEEELWIAVSYLDGEETKTTNFIVIDNEILHPDYIIL